MSQNKSVEQQETRKNGAKRKPCQENEMWREEKVKRRRSQEKEMSKEKDANRKRRQRKAAETTLVSRDSDDIRKSLSGEKSVSSLWPQICRQEGLSRFRNVRRKPDQVKVAASNKDVQSKKCQGQRLPRDHAVDGRASQASSVAVPIGFPLCSKVLPSLQTSVVVVVVAVPVAVGVVVGVVE